MLLATLMTSRVTRYRTHRAGLACILTIAAGIFSTSMPAATANEGNTILGGGRLSITKTIDGIPAGTALDDALFWVTVSCEGDEERGDAAIGITVNLPTLQLGTLPLATCTVTEVANPANDPAYVFPAPPAGYVWQPTLAPPVTVTTDTNGNATMTIVNTLQPTGSAAATPLPSLSASVLLLLAAVLGAFGMQQMRRRSRQ